jgi:magnesium transporter
MPEKKENPNQQVISDEALIDAIEEGAEDKLEEIVESLTGQEALRQVSLMGADERVKLISDLSPESAAKIVEEAHPEVIGPTIEDIDPEQAAQILQELPIDDQVDIFQVLDRKSSESILSEMDADNAENARQLSQYDPDSAGGIMGLDAFAFNANDTVGTVLQSLMKGDDAFERHRGQHPYILDDSGKLIGVVSLRSLLRNKRTVKLSDIMVTPVISVQPDAGQDELAVLFHENPFLGIPVVDSQELLLGVVSRIAVTEAALERAEIESLRRNRTGDELRSMPLTIRSKRRLSWLSANIVLNIIAASVISAYEETLAAVIAIAVFLPMVSDMSGCSGNQAVGVTMRELTLGLTKPSDLFHVLRKELSVGIINGIVLGILIGIVAWIWKDNAFLGLVIGLALSMNTLLAVSIGGIVPLMLKRFGIDPAVASGPLLTTVTDMAGFFLVLSLASLFMGQLLAG